MLSSILRPIQNTHSQEQSTRHKNPMRIEMNGNCFACGRQNPHGLHLAFSLDYEHLRAQTETIVDSRFIGWEEAVHGGITATLLDETMVYACGAAGKLVATASMSVKYRKPVPANTPILLQGKVLKNRKRFLTASATITRDGVVLAEGEGIFAVMQEVDDIDAYFNPPAAQ